MNINFILGIIVQVICVFIVLTVFFFTYATTVEGEVVKNNVAFMLKNIFGNNLNLLSDDAKETILEKIDSIETDSPEFKKANAEIDASNDEIKKNAFGTLITLSIGVAAIVILSLILSKTTNIQFFKGLKLGHIFKETAVIVLFVGITEYVFLTYFGAKWISVDPNVVRAHLFDNLEKGFSG
jgi:hypothetical protein